MSTPITDKAVDRVEKRHTKCRGGKNVTTRYRFAFQDLAKEMRKMERNLAFSEAVMYGVCSEIKYMSEDVKKMTREILRSEPKT